MLRGLSRGQPAKPVGVPRHYVQRIEQGRRGRNPWVAQRMAEELGVDLEALRAGPAEDAGTEGASAWGGAGARSRYIHNRSVHLAYLKGLLEREAQRLRAGGMKETKG